MSLGAEYFMLMLLRWDVSMARDSRDFNPLRHRRGLLGWVLVGGLKR